MEATGDSSPSDAHFACPVCCEHVDIFAFGLCEHFLCYKCWTRHRILGNSNSCPICRRDIEQILMTRQRPTCTFAQIDTKQWPADHANRLYFEDANIRQKYQQLLDFRCRVCPTVVVFSTMGKLKGHLRTDHEVHFCDLCLKGYQLFPSERRAYSIRQLRKHRTDGDGDTSALKGHPLCEFCKEYFLDRDELFRHLRTEHFFCHFCESDGRSNVFFCRYEDLNNHFKNDHFLCEEGECAEARFTNAFRHKLDLQAHKANAHSAGKRDRKVELQLLFDENRATTGKKRDERDNYSRDRERDSHNRDRERDNYRGRDRDRDRSDSDPPEQLPVNQGPAISSDAEFPSLGATTASQPAYAHAPAPIWRERIAPMNRLPEDFPALAASSHAPAPSWMGGKKKTTTMATAPSAAVVVNRPSASQRLLEEDFPALAPSSKAPSPSWSSTKSAPPPGTSGRAPSAYKSQQMMASEDDFPALSTKGRAAPVATAPTVWAYKPSGPANVAGPPKKRATAPAPDLSTPEPSAPDAAASAPKKKNKKKKKKAADSGPAENSDSAVHREEKPVLAVADAPKQIDKKEKQETAAEKQRTAEEFSLAYENDYPQFASNSLPAATVASAAAPTYSLDEDFPSLATKHDELVARVGGMQLSRPLRPPPGFGEVRPQAWAKPPPPPGLGGGGSFAGPPGF